MHETERKTVEYQELLDRFSKYISAHIQKYNLFKHGLDPDDIAQDIKFKIWKLIQRDKLVQIYPSYIRKIVDTSVIDQLRKLRREQGYVHCEKRRCVAEKELSYSRELSRLRDLEDHVGNAVETLPDSRRQVVKLYLMNLSIQEIAAYLNWSIDKTRNLLYRGMSDLKKILRELDIDHDHNR